MTMQPFLAFLPNIGMPELIVLAIIGLLLFGKRLPEVGKSLGKGIVEFKKGLSGVEEEVKKPTSASEPKQIADQSAEAHDVTEQQPSEQRSQGA